MSLRAQIRRAVNRVLAKAMHRPTPGRILLYHRVETGGDPLECVAPSELSGHLDAVHDAGLHCVGVVQCIRHNFPAELVGLSFDDGHSSVWDACQRILARGWSASLFVVPEWIDDQIRGAISWSALRELESAGVEIGLHGLRHERLTGPDEGILVRDLCAARARVEDQLGSETVGLAYPFGVAPRVARRSAALAGFSYACTTLPHRNRPGSDAYRLGRNEVHGTDGPRQLLGKLAGTDDWMTTVRRVENRILYGQ